MKRVLLAGVTGYLGSYIAAELGPIEFFLTTIPMDMSAPQHGKHTLSSYFAELRDARLEVGP